MVTTSKQKFRNDSKIGNSLWDIKYIYRSEEKVYLYNIKTLDAVLLVLVQINETKVLLK